jgi:DUF971 family protein
MSLQPEHLEPVGDFFAIRWNDGQESVIGLEDLRRACPCARCAGEPDVTGAVRIPVQKVDFSPSSFQLGGFEQVGRYAVAFSWGDGHDTGIYSWEMLRELGS